ncbi:hypothetical protein TrRE_jg3068 [Triparma retinervis]|uniref:Uncharacterized protein n=1 Tax=Triparma retinervis TaxID=2557542 RepID=A0A9W7E3G4_9STRA|nr:hypothetical protein TrRE_jg3068 [Triparma retinervis]
MRPCKNFTGGGTAIPNLSPCSNPNCNFAHIVKCHKRLQTASQATPCPKVCIQAEPSIQIFTASHDGAWRVWDASNNFTKVHEEKVGSKVNTVVVEGGWLFVGYDNVYDSTMQDGGAGGEGGSKATCFTVGQIMGYPLSPSGPGIPFHIAPMARYASAQSITSIVASGTGNDCVVVATGCDGMGRVWKIANGAWSCASVLSGHVRDVTGLAISGGHLWSCSTDCQIRIWDMGQGQCSHVIQAAKGQGQGQGDGHKGPVTCLEGFTMQGENYVVSGSLDGTVKIWDGKATLQATESQGQGVLSMASLEDTGSNMVLVIGLEKGNIMVRHLPSFMNLFTLDARYTFGHSGPVRSVVKGPSNTFYTTGEDGIVLVWQLVANIAGMIQG